MSSIEHCLAVQIHNDKTPLLCLVSFSNASSSPAIIHTLQRYTPWICRAWLSSLSSFLRLYCSPPLLTISKSCGSRGRASLLLPQDKESNHRKNPVPVLRISQRLRHVTEQSAWRPKIPFNNRSTVNGAPYSSCEHNILTKLGFRDALIISASTISEEKRDVVASMPQGKWWFVAKHAVLYAKRGHKQAIETSSQRLASCRRRSHRFVNEKLLQTRQRDGRW